MNNTPGERLDFTVKDSGVREQYDSGMIRDTQEGKPNYALIPTWVLERFAMHLTRGAEKYGPDNWQLACTREEEARFKASLFRHMVQLLNGERDEDHMSAVFFNAMALEYVRNRLSI